MNYITSSEELRKIHAAVKKGETAIETSLDLGKTRVIVDLKEGKVILPNKKKAELPKIRDDDKTCYIIEKNKFVKLQFFAEETNKLYQLVPTQNKPILKISGTPMHKMHFIERIKKAQLRGIILDSGTCLGYTAIAAAHNAKQVITIEWDPNVIEVAKLNPWSQELFTSPNIKQLIGDLTVEIKKFPAEHFDNIILDAGTVHESGDFFAKSNYVEVYRVLKHGGKLYHYLPQSGINRGRDYIGEIIHRLKDVGFKNIQRDEESSSVSAEK
jgi:predicted methyltransferase